MGSPSTEDKGQPGRTGYVIGRHAGRALWQQWTSLRVAMGGAALGVGQSAAIPSMLARKTRRISWSSRRGARVLQGLLGGAPSPPGCPPHNNAGELGLRRYSGSGQTSWERDERQGHCTEGQPPSTPCRPSTPRAGSRPCPRSIATPWPPGRARNKSTVGKGGGAAWIPSRSAAREARRRNCARRTGCRIPCSTSSRLRRSRRRRSKLERQSSWSIYW